MKKLLFFLTSIAAIGQLSAQDPYKALGIKENEIEYLTLSQGRYDEFHGYNDYEAVGSSVIDMQTNKIVRFMDEDSVIDESLLEFESTTRFLTQDPLAEKYFQLSPYGYCANNPILYIDPDGQEIYIYYTDNDGKQQQLKYTQGMKYDGDNKFVSTSVDFLNRVNSTEIGSSVVGNLVSSENAFNFKNELSKDANGKDITNQLTFKGSKDGGGDIQAGALIGNVLNDDQKLSLTAHELFHGYQKENGEDNQNSGQINREVGAYLFGEAVSQTYQFKNNGGASSFPFGNDSKAGKIYDDAMSGLLMAPSFNQTLYNTAGRTFKQGAVANSNGTYNRKTFNPNASNIMIKRFFPLIRY